VRSFNSDIVAGESIVNGCVLQEINAAPSPDYSTIVYQNTCAEFYSKPINFGKNVYSFSLTNEDGEPLDLNGLNINFTLLIYKQDTLFEKLKSFMKLKLLTE
jgi:hypothetical protein